MYMDGANMNAQVSGSDGRARRGSFGGACMRWRDVSDVGAGFESGKLVDRGGGVLQHSCGVLMTWVVCSGGFDEPGPHRGGRVPSESAQDVLYSSWRRRSWNGAHRSEEAPGSVPAIAPSGTFHSARWSGVCGFGYG